MQGGAGLAGRSRAPRPAAGDRSTASAQGSEPNRRETSGRKVELPLSIAEWRPAPIVGQVVLVTTCNEDGTTNVAPKCWAALVASHPLHLGFNCNRDHWTARNILRSREFVVNVPGSESAEKVWETARLAHPRTVEAAGFTAIPSGRVRPPRVAECHAHLECSLVRHLEFGNEVWLLAEVLAASADAEVTDAEDPFSVLRSFVYLEPGAYGIIGGARRVGSAVVPRETSRGLRRPRRVSRPSTNDPCPSTP